MFIESYWMRFVALLLFFLVIAAIDYLKNKQQATKWREYLFIIGSAISFGSFGFINDQITVSISESYFILGKGLTIDSLRLNASLLGFQAGSYAGIVVAILYLLKVKVIDVSYIVLLLQLLWKYCFIFVLLGVSVGCFLHMQGVSTMINTQGTELDLGFIMVWGWHSGLYLGLIFGLIHYFYAISKQSQQANE